MVLQPSVYEFVFTESAHSAKKGKVIVIVEACLNPLIVLNLCGKSQNRGVQIPRYKSSYFWVHDAIQLETQQLLKIGI